jgi:hypothetical protein
MANKSVRIAGGVLVICSAGHDTVDGVVEAAYIILQVGVIPAFMVLIGLIMLMSVLQILRDWPMSNIYRRKIDYPQSERMRKLILGTRLYLGGSVALLVAGTVLVANNENSTSPTKADDLKTADGLIKAGFGCVAGLMGLLCLWDAWLWTVATLTHYSRLVSIPSMFLFDLIVPDLGLLHNVSSNLGHPLRLLVVGCIFQ